MHETLSRAASTDDVARGLDLLEQQFEQFSIAFRQRMKARAAAIHPCLPPAGYRTLTTLAHVGPVNQSVLTETLGVEKSVLSRQLHQLIGLGLVTRAQDPQDGRAAIVEVTPAARARLAAVHGAARDSFRQRLTEWDPRDLEHLTGLLARLWSEHAG
jgi:DNA-binding MarR family transcriptional regulator